MRQRLASVSLRNSTLHPCYRDNGLLLKVSDGPSRAVVEPAFVVSTL